MERLNSSINDSVKSTRVPFLREIVQSKIASMFSNGIPFPALADTEGKLDHVHVQIDCRNQLNTHFPPNIAKRGLLDCVVGGMNMPPALAFRLWIQLSG